MAQARATDPGLTRLVELPMIYGATEITELTGPSYATWGLDLHPASRPAFAPAPALLDWRRRLERPDLYDDLGDWRLIRGVDLRPPTTPRSRDEELIAAWLELCFWWWCALEAANDPMRQHVGVLCKKLVAEPERVRLWLECRERPGGRTAILEQLAAHDGPEREAAATVLALDARPSSEPPLDLALASLTRQTIALATLIDTEAFGAGRTAVRLTGSRTLVPGVVLDAATDERPRRHLGGALPLCDWQSLAVSACADESFEVSGGPLTARSLASASGEAGATVRVMSTGELLVFPRHERGRPLPRRIACAATDPVSFALLAGLDEAVFPGLRGLDVADVAARAVTEQRRRVVVQRGSVGTRTRATELAVAARAALLHESVEAGSPTLPLTILGTLAMLAERLPDGAGVCAELSDALVAGDEPKEPVVSRLEALVGSLPAYRR